VGRGGQHSASGNSYGFPWTGLLIEGMQVQLDALRIGRLTINGEQVPPSALADRERDVLNSL